MRHMAHLGQLLPLAQTAAGGPWEGLWPLAAPVGPAAHFNAPSPLRPGFCPVYPALKAPVCALASPIATPLRDGRRDATSV
jgi:hypothetical protein